MLYSRYITFMQSISKHQKFPVQFLFQLTRSNLLSVTGRNIRKILDETGQEDILEIKVTELKKTFKFWRTEEENKWKVEMIKELVNVKQGTLFIDDEENEELLTRAEIDKIIHFVAAS